MRNPKEEVLHASRDGEVEHFIINEDSIVQIEVDTVHANTRRYICTNLPCRHSGIRPQYDPSIKLYGNDGRL